MSTIENETARPLSGTFTALAVFLFLGGFYLSGSIFLAAQAWYVRFLAVVIGCVSATGALSQTEYWQKIRSLARGARIEMRKVFWPGKQEWLRATGMVFAVVIVFAIFLLTVDMLLAWLIRMVL